MDYSLPIPPIFSYCRHDRSAATYARLHWPNHRNLGPSCIFVAHGGDVHIFRELTGTAEAAELIAALTDHYSGLAIPAGLPPVRLDPINQRYFQARHLSTDHPETAGAILGLIGHEGPDAARERRRIIQAWQRHQLDSNHNQHNERGEHG